MKCNFDYFYGAQADQFSFIRIPRVILTDASFKELSIQAKVLYDIDTWMFFKYVFKMGIAVYLLSNTFNMTMAVFDVGQHVVNAAAGVLSHDTAIDVTALIAQTETAMVDMEIGALVVLALESLVVSLGMKLMSIVITVACYGRMIEIYLYISVAPIPFATLTNRE